MRTLTHRPGSCRPAWVLAAGLVALLVWPLSAQIRAGFKGSGSKYPEFNPLQPTGGSIAVSPALKSPEAAPAAEL